MSAPTSTYRLQLHAAGDGVPAFGFDEAIAQLDYLRRLGVGAVYLSPILSAAEGSQHGYDVIDPTTVSAALGGPEGLARLSAAARERGLGLVVDIVPNHVGVETPSENAWWWDVLRHGRDSAYASYFDIDWAPDNGCNGRIALPVLGSATDVEALEVVGAGDDAELGFYEHRFPVAPGTLGGTAQEVHDRQAYQLVPWRSGLVGYRRFFHVNGLAALRMEDETVFDATHAEIRRWAQDGVVDGIRVDHPDGLADPAGYLARLRGAIGDDRWLVIEKILAPDEALDTSLPADGTTGYDALREVGGVFVDPSGAEPLSAIAVQRTGAAGDAEQLHATEHELKLGVARAGLRPELERCVRAIEAGDAAHDQLVDAVVELVAAVPVYRADYPSLAGMLPAVVAQVSVARPELSAALSRVSAALVAGGEAATRFQQVCGAVTAKGVEDCLFYRTNRLVSLQEVGGDPGRFGVSPAEMHLAFAERATLWPAAMTTLSTHDTKRGEDVRSRIAVLSEVPQLWAQALERWEEVAPSPDGGMGSFLWQNIFGVWPADGRTAADVPQLRERLHAYAEKAAREAGTRTEWNEVDEEFEQAMHTWIDQVLDGPVAASMGQLVADLAPRGWSNSLGQKLLQLAGPGVPDVYQGTELWEDSLVDPDNRREVDYDRRTKLLSTLDTVPPVDPSGAAKLLVVSKTLSLRRERPESFVGGTYAPVLAEGEQAEHLVGFSRGPQGDAADVLALATRLSVTLGDWGSTTVALPTGEWTDRLTGQSYRDKLSLAEVFGRLPVALLVRS
ncbi:malto-oligosyltrehalose synthase [Rhodococcus sp. X156]|uniref:malto-oligosyltrehalose synthase n=1 Tax=Rhodococcus sp. X156 TaxID=2499145 RepID=UPI000FD9A697|nr:malto-oligosyltrehalose synthase [Rhodococcus sp. X156]